MTRMNVMQMLSINSCVQVAAAMCVSFISQPGHGVHGRMLALYTCSFGWVHTCVSNFGSALCLAVMCCSESSCYSPQCAALSAAPPCVRDTQHQVGHKAIATVIRWILAESDVQMSTFT